MQVGSPIRHRQCPLVLSRMSRSFKEQELGILFNALAHHPHQKWDTVLMKLVFHLCTGSEAIAAVRHLNILSVVQEEVSVVTETYDGQSWEECQKRCKPCNKSQPQHNCCLAAVFYPNGTCAIFDTDGGECSSYTITVAQTTDKVIAYFPRGCGIAMYVFDGEQDLQRGTVFFHKHLLHPL